ncbi:MAG: cohesin domain-containing protein [Candidatus Thermoplasmatota archaeon]
MKKMKNYGVEKRGVLRSTVCAVLILLMIILPSSIKADGPTLVQVSPASSTVSAGQTFTISIACTPGQSIKSYELDLSFNPTLLHANSVTEGTIFTGYTTFFNAGTINNTAGTILDIYGLIVGTGGVTNPGTLVSLSFTAQAASGTTTIGLFDVGITNESAYVPITVTNGTVTLREFTLTVTLDGSGSVTKNPNYATYPYGTVVQLTAVPTTGWVFTSWSGNLSGSTNPASITMTGNKSVTAHFTANQYTLTITTTGSGTVTKNPNQVTYNYGQVVTVTAVPSAGWAFESWTGDLTGSQNPTTITMNGNKAVVAHFEDALLPQILNIARTTSDPLDTSPTYGWVNISCTVTDNVGVSQVVLRIHTPAGSWNNVSMTAGSAGKYYYRTTTAFSMAGNYSYSIRAIDTNNNINTSSTILFSMPPNWDINNDGTCGIFDFVLISNHYGQSGTNGWIREDADNNGLIQVLDLVYVSNHYGETWW